MASKTYTVMKDGETIKELKTLAAAKKLADTEDAEVFSEGVCVYAPDPPVCDSDPEDGISFADISDETGVDDTVIEGGIDTLGSLPAGEPHVKVETITPEKYMLTAKMNIRKAPSLSALKLGIAKKGTVVEVTDVKNGWLHLLDGTFILYEGGRWAQKCT